MPGIYTEKVPFGCLKMLHWGRWGFMSRGHKRGRTNSGRKGEVCGKDFRNIQGWWGLTWILPHWNEMKCKRNSAVKVHLASPLFLGVHISPVPFLSPKWQPWGVVLCQGDPHSGQVSYLGSLSSPWCQMLAQHPSRAALSHPAAHALEGTPQPRDHSQNQVSSMMKLSPTLAGWSFCQQRHALRGLGLP